MPDAPADEEQQRLETQVQQVLRALADRGDVNLPADQLEQAVRDALAELREAPVQDFVVLLAERMVRQRLQGLGEA
jgi:hypothetical protein